MGRIIKRQLIIFIVGIFIVDAMIGYFLFTSRAFSHLAIWDIMESNKESDFYWKPEKAPRYFYFEPKESNALIFRNEILPLIGNENKEFNIMLKVARYALPFRLRESPSATHGVGLPVKWDSPEGMLRQIKDGRTANCFHRAILFSTYLSSIGIKSRLWALENEGFDARSHTINEVYIKDLNKWVFIDMMSGFYFTTNRNPLSFLEFRKMLLEGSNNKILVHDIQNENKKRDIPFNYRRLIRCVFLRSGNDFVNKYNLRYGVFNALQTYIDKLPDNIRRGLDYLLGRRDAFIHYVDKYSKALTPKIMMAKLSFYFFILSPLLIVVILAINLSKKDTLHI